jgi:energy-coupling factor transport system permease protein
MLGDGGRRSCLHALDPRVKLAYSVSVALAGTMLGHPLLLAALLMLTLLPWLVLRPPLAGLRFLLVVAALGAAGMIVSQGFFYHGGPRTPLLTLPFGLNVAWEGLTYGAVQSMRLLAVVSAALLVVACSHASDLLLAMTSLGLPQELAFMLVLALRFLPEAIEQGQRILVAQQLRGVRGRGPLGAVRRMALMVPPLLGCLVRHARQTALAAEARAWTPRRQTVRTLRLSATDRLVLAALAALVIAAFAAMWSGYGAPPGGIR